MVDVCVWWICRFIVVSYICCKHNSTILNCRRQLSHQLFNEHFNVRTARLAHCTPCRKLEFPFGGHTFYGIHISCNWHEISLFWWKSCYIFNVGDVLRVFVRIRKANISEDHIFSVFSKLINNKHLNVDRFTPNV